MLSHSHKRGKNWLGKWHGIRVEGGKSQDILTPGINVFIFSRFGIKLRWKVSFALQFLKVKIPPHVHKSFKCFFYQPTLLHVREHLEWWAVIKKINLYNLPEIIRQHKISNCSNFIRHQEFSIMPKMFGQKWKISWTLLYSANVQNFWAWGVFRVPKFLWAEMQKKKKKKQPFYIVPGQNKNFQKCPNFFKHPGKIQNTLDYCLGGSLFQ